MRRGGESGSERYRAGRRGTGRGGGGVNRGERSRGERGIRRRGDRGYAGLNILGNPDPQNDVPKLRQPNDQSLWASDRQRDITGIRRR